VQAPQPEAAAPVFRPDFCTPESRPYVLVAAILASALGFIDGTVVAIAMPAIRVALDASLAQAQWVHNAYMLTLSALILVGGAMGDRFGLARVFSLGIWLFLAASVLCAVAPTANFLIAVRAVQGVGAAIMVPGSLAIIARAYPREDRGRAIGIWAAASALTTALGPVIGGAALSWGGDGMWRWIFAVNVPLGAIALWLLARKIGRDTARPGTRLDWPGACLATLALALIAWGLTQAQHGAGAWGIAAAGAAVLAAFLWTESRSDAPMMPLSLFRSRPFSVVNLLCFVLYSGLNITLFFLPMALIAGWGLTPLAASLSFAPLSVFIFLLSARMGRAADRIGVRPLLAGGSSVVALGYAALALAAPAQDFWLGVLGPMAIVGLGMAAVVAPLSTAVMAAVDDAHAGTASGVNNAITRMAGLISVAAVGGLVASVYAAGGGMAGFGIAAPGAAHADASGDVLQALAWLAAALSGFSAALAFWALRGLPAPAES
jgi:EmrB/QacA subfamily drug resistance transporter